MKKLSVLLFALLIIVSSIASCSDDGVVNESLDFNSNESTDISKDNSDVVASENEESVPDTSSDFDVSSENNNDNSSDAEDTGDNSSDISEEILDETSVDLSEDVSEDNNKTPEQGGTDEGDKNEIITLFDSSALENYESPFLPSYAPFSLYDTTLFSDSVITSISFPFDSLASGYTVDSDKLYFPVYVVKSDFSTPKNECTIENGKKIIIDFTGKLSEVKRGDWLTVDGLEIKVSHGETLAFGDTDMAVLPMFLRNNGTFGFWNRVFDAKGGNNHSLIFKIEGYKNTSEDNDSDVNNGGNDKKYISFLGDSISTYSGWSNNTSYNNSIGNNAIWYPNNNYNGANIAVQETWWHKVADELGYEIAVNNSWSGSVVKDAQTYNVRAKNLHNTTTGAKPDVVVIFMGVNDYAAGTAIGAYDGAYVPPANPNSFSEAYGKIIQNIKDSYEGVEIYCCTFLPDRKRNSGSVNAKGIDEKAYNNAIRTIAENMGVKVIDLYNNSGITPDNISQYTVDKLHPNKLGMSLVAKTIIDAIK